MIRASSSERQAVNRLTISGLGQALRDLMRDGSIPRHWGKRFVADDNLSRLAAALDLAAEASPLARGLVLWFHIPTRGEWVLGPFTGRPPRRVRFPGGPEFPDMPGNVQCPLVSGARRACVQIRTAVEDPEIFALASALRVLADYLPDLDPNS